MSVILGIGKRKKAIARATISKGKGNVRINSIPLSLYEPALNRMRIQEALEMAGSLSQTVDISVRVNGGGVSAQTDAVRTAIGSGLVDYSKNDELRKTLKEYDRSLIVSDMRQQEKKKPGGRGARAKAQKSYR